MYNTINILVQTICDHESISVQYKLMRQRFHSVCNQSTGLLTPRHVTTPIVFLWGLCFLCYGLYFFMRLRGLMTACFLQIKTKDKLIVAFRHLIDILELCLRVTGSLQSLLSPFAASIHICFSIQTEHLHLLGSTLTDYLEALLMKNQDKSQKKGQLLRN